ncbi:hypothetical protein [Corynebacterium sphenisci]|uniref:hypothetical protein n=1 Tax=Corynebacterium sphenisci TaxID=191493 RepID=UPI0026E083A3|nr:hypothetical protein [Corynebacterium sphenisci]MDO5730790.1 hypothetical protein [Corynebacterium sphenisci]
MARSKKPSAPAHVTTVTGDTAHITPVDPADTPVIARLLLDAAGSPADVATTTGPAGWRVPAALARKTGLG